MSRIWAGVVINWKEPKIWSNSISRWLRPRLNKNGIGHLKSMGVQKICWDDPEWLDFLSLILEDDVENVIRDLSKSISQSKVRAYHGCRTENTALYHRDGILLNDPRTLSDYAKRIVQEEDALFYMRPGISKILDSYEHADRDIGRLYLALDDRSIINDAGHYLLYGSEWIQCALGISARAVLRTRGIPTILLIDLPICMIESGAREELARALLQEWTHIKVNRPRFVPEKDFTFCLKERVPQSMIVSHYHPEYVRDPYNLYKEWRTEKVYCLSCAPQ